MIYPSQQDFLKLAEKGNLIPVYREITADLDTPVSAYYKLTNRDKGSVDYAFLLESVEGEEKIARYSFLATDPELIIRGKGETIELTRLHNGKKTTETRTGVKHPLDVIREVISAFRFVEVPGLPRFCGGLVGYLGYDIVRTIEHLPDRPTDDLGLPETLLVLAQDLVIFDHRNHSIKVVHSVHLPKSSSRETRMKAYRAAETRINKLVAKIRNPLTIRGIAKFRKPVKPAVESNVTEDEFCRMVTAAKAKIRAGDIIQVVLSQRFAVDIPVTPFLIYRTLRRLNPSPYMYFLKFGDIQLVGSSPELLVRCEDRVVETRPIAGTRPRGRDEAEDAALAKDLLNDPKERAEHIMLVDLGRNDLGRVCRQGTVQLSEFMQVEKYSHVMHIVSNVQGRLKPGKDALDVLAAAFPAGTLSGAPKIRAMEIIDELENVSRGPYGGCIGYFSFSGNLDSCITIRTIVIHKGRAYVQAGAGIVADSNPKKEYQETLNKARAQLLAIEKAAERDE